MTDPSSLLTRAFTHNAAWVDAHLAKDPAYFARLAEGQAPEVLYVGCSDSRVTAEELMGAEPGQVFVHRNVANQVVPTDANFNAVLQYAVEHLKVKHIVVCGHYRCGGVHAALHPSDLGQLNSWLQTLRDVRRLHRAELEAIDDPTARFDRLVELNVREQCINVIKSHHVQRSWYATGFPKVHGWVFDVGSGRLLDLGLDMEREFREVRAIYDLRPTVGEAR